MNEKEYLILEAQMAISQNNIALLKRIVNNPDFDINFPIESGMSLLTYAYEFRKYESANILLECLNIFIDFSYLLKAISSRKTIKSEVTKDFQEFSNNLLKKYITKYNQEDSNSEAVVYATSNTGKIARAFEQFLAEGLDLKWLNHDCAEPEINDIEYISKHKAKEAYELTGSPCFVIDSGFYIDAYPDEPGFPGAFPKRLINNVQGEKDGIDLLLEKMSGITNRNCRFIDCLTYYDGVEFKVFYGIDEGQLAFEKKGITHIKARSNLWYVFIRKTKNKTLAEMTDEEREAYSPFHTSATMEFITWYKALIQEKMSVQNNLIKGSKEV